MTTTEQTQSVEQIDRYAVVGHPIGHSRSPYIHARFAAQTREPVEYGAIDTPPEDFEETVRTFFAEGGRGLNITVPHKQQAWELSEWRSDGAERSGAVNTLFIDDSGRLCGHNTDGVGLVRDITENHGGVIAGRRLLLLGAGGAVRGVLPALLARKPATVCIANRTEARAAELAEHFSDQQVIDSRGYPALRGRQFDLVINGTSAGLTDELPPLPENLLAEGAWCYDMVYRKGATAFQAWATAHGAEQAIDGCGMLVEQAAQAFYIWRGVMPATAAVITALRQNLAH